MNNNPFNDFLKVANGGNPMDLLNKQLQSNPQLKQMEGQIRNMMQSSKMSPKDFAMQYCQKMGVDPQQLEMLAKKMGVQ